MSTINVPRDSHSDPNKYRIKLEAANRILGPDARLPEDNSKPIKYTSSKVAIVGAGFGGIGSAMSLKNQLKEEDFVIFERHTNFGGTWYANTYPGCASDIPAVWYSFSDELNSNWSEVQPPQYEMEEYILSVVEKHGLRKYARLGKSVSQLSWDDEESVWRLKITDVLTGDVNIHTSQVVYCSTGGLVYPNQLNSKGLETFKGDYMHSALFDHSVSFKNKKVVVIGSGCSATQLIPVLLRDYEVESITQIARSKQFILPGISPLLQVLYKLLSFSRWGLLFVRYFVTSVAEARFPIFKGSSLFSRFVRFYESLIAFHYMKSRCPKKFQDKIIPEFKIGCKRLIFDHDYLDSLHNPIMDVRSENIDHISENSIVLTDGSVLEADIIVACTGYSLRKAYGSYSIIGRDGFDVQKEWNNSCPTAYNTITIRDCPNLFVIGGPNSATGHSSVVMAIENALQFTNKVVPKILSGKYVSICVKTEKYNAWFKEIQAELKKCVFGTPFGGCVSWYTENEYNFVTYPYSQFYYWWKTKFPKWQDFEIKLRKVD